jgi:putative oxidoreductase
MFRWYGYLPGAASVGLLVLRLAAGAALIVHGSSKIYDHGDNGGWRFEKATTWMDKFPAPPPPYLQAAAVVAEFGGGIALVLGFLTPLFSLMVACTMATAYALVHYREGHPFVSHGGPSFELSAVYFAVAVCLLLVGPGQLSLDYCLFGRRRRPAADLPPYTPR